MVKKNIDFLVHCTHTYKLNNGQKIELVNFDIYDLLRDHDLAMKFKLALVENKLHSDEMGFYSKELSGNMDKQYIDTLNSVIKSFKEIVKKETVIVSLESEHKNNDRHSIDIVKSVDV